MDFFDASCFAIQVAQRVYQLYQTAKSNKSKCALLGKLCNEIGLLLEDNFGNRQKSVKWLGNKVVFDRIQSIRYHLQNAEDMIRKFTSKQGLEKGLAIVNAFNIDAKFQQMIEDLKDAEQQLVQAISLKAAVQLQDDSSQDLEGKQRLIQEFMQAAEQDRKRDTAEIQRMLQVLQNDNYTALQKQQAIQEFLQSSEQDRKKDSVQKQQLLQILQSESTSMLEKQRCIQQFLHVAEEERKKDSAEVQKLLQILQDGQVASWEKQRRIQEFLVSADKHREYDSAQMQQLIKALQSDNKSLLEKQTSIQAFLHAAEQERKEEFEEIQALFQVLQSESKATWEKQRSIHEFVISAEQKREQDADHMKDMLQALQSDHTSMLEKQRYIESFLQSANEDRKRDAEQVQKLLQVLQSENVAAWEKQRSIHEFLTAAEEERKLDSMEIRKQLDVMHQSEKQTLESVQRQLEDMRELLMKRSCIIMGSSSSSASKQSDREYSFFIEPEHLEYEVCAKKSKGDNRVKLGQGGFGTVYKAKLRRTLVVAVKVVDDSAHSKDTIEELMREVRIMSRLSHRNIIGFYGGFYPLQPRNAGDEELEEEAYLVMELAENRSFGHHLFSGSGSSMPIAKKIEILSGVADGLCYLHFRNIVHRDIKPDNVLLDREFVPKLSDFGLAKIKETSLSSRSHAGAVGTLGYQSPETMRSEKPSFPADIWSFGITMIECIINERVYAGLNMTLVYEMVCVKNKVPLDKIKPHESQWPKGYVELIKSCLRFDVNRRPTAMDLSVVMRGIMEKSTSAASPISGLDDLALDGKPGLMDPMSEEPPWSRVNAFASNSVMSAVTTTSSRAFGAMTATSTSTPRNVASRKLSAQEIQDLYERGMSFRCERGVEQDYARAAEHYRQAANHGHAAAQFELGACYYNGHGVTKDYKQAIEWYRLAADQEHSAAQNFLGFCYYNGHGVTQDHKQAVEWYRLAAKQGHAEAQHNLGYCYAKGRGVREDYRQAVEWYRLAADQNHTRAQYNLGVCYHNGEGVARDDKQAAEWYRLAANQGHAGAQCGVGLCYHEGQGLSQDYKEAVKWYRMAANQGHTGAQFNLGLCYKDGNGVAKSLAEARKWYQLAADQGDDDAKEALSNM